MGKGIDALGCLDEPDVHEHIEMVHANLTPQAFATAALAAWMRPDRPYLTVAPASP